MAKSELNGKKVILISVKFFNYESLIKDKLNSMGAQVDLFDERPSNSFFSKAVIRLRKSAYASTINRYFRSIIEKIKDVKYDYFLLIKGEVTPRFFIDFIRCNNPNIKLIYYTYDSFKNNSNGLQILNYFDRKYTFDNEDAKNYKIFFRPLFYAEDYRKLYSKEAVFKNDLAFIGTAHSDRYLISERLRKWCGENGLIMFAFYFSPSRLLFKYKKLTDSKFRTFDFKKISFQSLSHTEIIELYESSRAVLDINHPDQKGLTMRTFETLGAGRKLITTNPEVVKYPFFDSQNIYVIDRNVKVLDLDFFKTSFNAIEPELLKSMSLEGWIEEVFGLTNRPFWEAVIT